MTDIVAYTGIDATPNRERIFVFGSNERGIHGGGAAKAAFDLHGAVRGQGFGRQGRSFGIPTCSVPTSQPNFEIPLDTIQYYVYCFLMYAKLHPELDFQVTRVGCGFVGLTDADMAPMFREAPDNCLFDAKWESYLPGRKFWGTF